ncbi:MAG TPA: tetratricopeptide repeat protein [Polyangiaceae bacterium]|nr:tetratricopeptide repeat protein [Polyangiaceae bacterium]
MLFRYVPLVLACVLLAAQANAQGDPLERARRAYATSEYETAEKDLKGLKNIGGNADALILKSRILLRTGRYGEAAKIARQAMRLGGDAKAKAAPWAAEALFRLGKRNDAIDAVREVEKEPGAHRARLVLGELLLGAGKRSEGEQPLMEIVQAYNNDEITSSDAEGLSLVGRAAYLLRAYQDSNRAFNEAEKAGANKRVETLLWRAELFLDKYDPGHAAEVTIEAAKLAPNDPRVLVMLAHVKLDQTLDFGAAEELVDKALRADPVLAEAYFVRAGLALRVMDLAAADQAVVYGLKTNPQDLDLLSMKAAVRFLAEDRPGFEATEKQVLALNREYSRFYSIVGEFAEWEHRYDEIVQLMRKAAQVDPNDAKAYAALGLNLIRAGDEKNGLAEIKKAWSRDKYNVRVYNTLNLYEDTIGKDYTTTDGTRFRIRYHKHEKPVLERYVPRMLESAWGKMVKRYGFTPTTPVGIELYADSEHFSVRTSGLPNVGIQGVCFGKTLAALSPGAGSFNWGMILWHELAHVFHIQMSKSRVPRWFTEGLAEYETIVERPEWRREEELALFYGLRARKIPAVESFNRAFTHVDDPQDITMAYFAASQIAVFMADEFGFPKVVKMLPAWAEGKRTPEIVQDTFGVSAEELDRRFKKWLEPRLERYRKQFVPKVGQPLPVEEARRAVAEHPKSADKHVDLALSQLATGSKAEAEATLKLALALDPKEPNATYTLMRLAMAQKDLKRAEKLGKQLIAQKHDGFALRMRMADIAEMKGDKAGMRKHLQAAHVQDPSQAEPLQALHDLAREAKDAPTELFTLRQLAKLEQHDRRVWHRLLAMLVQRGLWEEARAVGQSAIYVDVMSPEMHYLYARALARTGKQVSAIYELNSAIKARPKPQDAAKIYRAMATGYRKLKKREYADRADKYAQRMAGMKRR